MKTLFLLLAGVLICSFAFAGDKVYTDDDLGKYKQENYEKTYQYNQRVFEQNKIEYERQKEIERDSFKVGNRELTLGMTKDEVIKEIGQPDKINRSGGSYGIQEQWIYSSSVTRYGGRRFYQTKENYLYLYFDNDILTSYQM